MIIKILGSGCPNCLKLEANAKQAIDELGLDNLKIEHVYDFEEILEYGVMATPAIVIDEKIMAAGRIVPVEEIKTWVKK